ncbi:MAG: TolC family protein [Treponema sp.]|nr:TolC family protein [Treponema sp.]
MKRLIITITLMSIINGTLCAQTINLEQARNHALASSRSLARYELAIRSSVLDERNQLYSMLPSVSADVRASAHYLRDFLFINPADTISAGASLSITQILFQGGKSFIRKAISEIATESVKKDALSEYYNVLDTVDSAFYTALEAMAALEAEEFSLQASDLALTIAQLRYENGIINHGDYLRALAEKESRENSCSKARYDLTLYLTRLKTITGIQELANPEPVSFDAYEDALLRFTKITNEEIDVLYGKLWQMITSQNPSLSKAVLNNQRAQRNHMLTGRDYSPVISATVFSADLNLVPGRNLSSGGGITLRGSIPVDFWVMSNRMESSRLSLDAAALDYINAQSSLEQELHNALVNIFTQAGTVLSSRRSLEYTQRHFEYVMERYRLSQSSVSDLNEATSLYNTSRNNLNRASFTFLRGLSRLRSLCALEDESELLKILLEG